MHFGMAKVILAIIIMKLLNWHFPFFLSPFSTMSQFSHLIPSCFFAPERKFFNVLVIDDCFQWKFSRKWENGQGKSKVIYVLNSIIGMDILMSFFCWSGFCGIMKLFGFSISGSKDQMYFESIQNYVWLLWKLKRKWQKEDRVP